jgi:hypothetical protein
MHQIFSGHERKRSALNLEILCWCFASIRDFLIFDNLPLIQTAKTGSLNGRDVDEHVFATAARRLNEAIALCGLNHFTVPLAIFVSKSGRIHLLAVLIAARTAIRLPVSLHEAVWQFPGPTRKKG